MKKNQAAKAVQKKTVFTSAPKSFDFDGVEADEDITGTHRIGAPIRAAVVPEDLFYDQVKAYWLGGHMAVEPVEFKEMVASGLIVPAVQL